MKEIEISLVGSGEKIALSCMDYLSDETIDACLASLQVIVDAKDLGKEKNVDLLGELNGGVIVSYASGEGDDPVTALKKAFGGAAVCYDLERAQKVALSVYGGKSFGMEECGLVGALTKAVVPDATVLFTVICDAYREGVRIESTFFA